MKKIIPFLITICCAAACKKMEYFQTNPNAASTPIPNLLLTSLEKNMFSFSPISSNGTNEGSFYFSMAAALQYHVGFSDHSILTQSYQWASNSMDEYLQINDANELIRAAGTNNNYVALGKLFLAISYYSLTGKFGDIPLSQAGQLKNGINTPLYDSQKNVYQYILAQLDTANMILSDPQGTIQGDFLYGNNLVRWRKFVNSMRLRMILSLSNKVNDPDLNPSQLFTAMMESPGTYPLITDNQDNAQQTTTTVTPFPHYNNPELVYYGLGEAFADSLIAFRDPRLRHFANVTDVAAEAGVSPNVYESYGGLPPDVSNSVNTANQAKSSAPNSNYFSQPDYEPNLYLGAYEVNFAIAEGIARGWWNGADAEKYYKSGISSSLSYYKIDQDTIDRYLSEPSVVYKSGDGLRQILFQRYLAGLYNSGYEPYFTQRRSQTPAMQVSGPGIPSHQQPLRWQYPLSEYTLNNANVTQAVNRQYPKGDIIFEKMWILNP